MTQIYRSLGSFMATVTAVFVLAVLMLVPLLIAPRAVAAAPMVRSQCRAGPVVNTANQRTNRQRPLMNRYGRRHS